MDDAHKAAISSSRLASRAINAYLDNLNAPRRRRMRPETLRRRLEALKRQMDGLPPAKRVLFLQKRIDLEAELAEVESSNREVLEAGFIAVAKDFSERKGITRDAWLEAGVPIRVIREAGL